MFLTLEFAVKLFRGCSGDIVSSNENNFVSSDTAATLLFQNAFLHIIQYIFKDIIDIIYLTVTPLTLVEGSTCLSSLLAPKRVEIEDMFESGDKEATSMRVLKAAKITSSSVGHDTSCEEN